MSFIDYYAKLFDNYGDWAIRLTEAINLIILSAKKRIDREKKEEAKKILDELLTKLLKEDTGKDIELARLHDDFKKLLQDNYNKDRLKNIKEKINNYQNLDESEIRLIDCIINNFNNQATIAFRRMKRGR